MTCLFFLFVLLGLGYLALKALGNPGVQGGLATLLAQWLKR